MALADREFVLTMKTRVYFDRALHALTGSLAMLAQRMPFIKNLCPFLGSSPTLKMATPMTVTFRGVHTLSGQTVEVVPLDETFPNPVEGQLNEEFQWAFIADGSVMGSFVVEGLPEGLTSSFFSEELGIGQIVGRPLESGVFAVTITAWLHPNMVGDNTPPYSLTINVPAPADPYTAWRVLNWEGTDYDDPAISGPNADPDKDGIENLLEFVLDLDPNEISQMPGEITIDPEDDSKLRYEIPLNSDASDLNVVIQENSTLEQENWTDVSGNSVTRTDSKIVLSIPKGPGRKFYRLRVEL